MMISYRPLSSSLALLTLLGVAGQGLLSCDEDPFATLSVVDAGAHPDSGRGGAGPSPSTGGGGAGGYRSPGQVELDGGVAGNSAVALDGGPLEPFDSGDGCAPTTLFRDADGDAYGDVSEQRTGCPEPGWVTQSGDCRDDNPLVHAGQVEFFGVGYVDADQPGGVSFDYDCSGAEDADASNTPPSGEPRCDVLALLTCIGSGYSSASGREGPGIGPLCGSRVRVDCVARVVIGCGSVATDLPEEEAFRCR